MAIENAQLYAQTYQLSITDTLTGLYNRRYFFDLAEVELARGRRYDHRVAAIMIDLDHFKNVNDQYGHVVGDEVLRQVARRFRGQLRTVDILARYGGEEFVVLLPETDLEKAVAVADRLRESVAESPVAVDGLLVAITISVGIAIFGLHAKGLDSLLGCADSALYQAKNAGRNRVSVHRGEQSAS